MRSITATSTRAARLIGTTIISGSTPESMAYSAAPIAPATLAGTSDTARVARAPLSKAATILFAEYRCRATLVSCIVGIDSRANGATHSQVTAPRKRLWFPISSRLIIYPAGFLSFPLRSLSVCLSLMVLSKILTKPVAKCLLLAVSPH